MFQNTLMIESADKTIIIQFSRRLGIFMFNKEIPLDVFVRAIMNTNKSITKNDIKNFNSLLWCS